MPRTYSQCSEDKNYRPKTSNDFGIPLSKFDVRKRSQLLKKVESTDTDCIHYIKHTPLRLTRTRASYPFINSNELPNNNSQSKDNSSMRKSSIELELFSKGFCRSNSLIAENDSILIASSDVILTPYAQILSNLHLVRDNISDIAEKYFIQNKENGNEYDSEYNYEITTTITETCDTLDWCLNTLELATTNRTISDLTALKFQRILNEELKQNDDTSSKVQLCEYMCDTFLEKTIMNEESFMEETDFVNDEDTLDNTGITYLSMKTNCTSSIMQMIDLSIDVWGMDLFELSGFTNNVFTLTIFSIFKKRQFLSKFNIPEDTLVNFLLTVECNYRNVPYHNSIHAADVTQSSHVTLNSIGLQDVFTDLEMLAVIFASAIHDVDHPGVSNQFLINTNDPLAILYNDHSVLENHHLATAFRLLGDGKCDILGNLNKEDKTKFRKLVIDMVLATDMSFHISLLADLKTMIETKKVMGSGLLNLDNYHDRIKILQCVIHCADLSNPTKSLPIYQKWVTRILEEFFIQGDRERDLGLDLSPMCDRYISTDDATQIGFIDYIVHPLWNTWCDLVDQEADNVLQNLCENRKFYIDRMGNRNK